MEEAEIIELLKNKFKSSQKDSDIVLGIGDDAAIVSNKKQLTVLTHDMLVENVHFDMVYTPIKYLAYKSVVVNLSDIYAMNAIPKYILLGLALSSKYTKEALDEFLLGLKQATQAYNVNLIGGDITTSPRGMQIGITCMGQVEEKNYVKISEAKENDIICVTGDLGAAFTGLKILQREKKIFLENPNIKNDFGQSNHHILQKQLKPEAKKEIIEFFEKQSIKPSSMTDLSDGLSKGIINICKSKNLGAHIYEQKIPIHQNTKSVCKQLNLDPLFCAMSGGEDYELLFTVAPKLYEKIKINADIHAIGYVHKKDKKYSIIKTSGQVMDMKDKSWDPFNG